MNQESIELREVMQKFITERLEVKLAKLKPEEETKREKYVEDFALDTWLLDAARRVAQIQTATHTLKPMHPEARGTSLHVESSGLEVFGLVGTQSLGTTRTNDVVGNAAALDVFKFLSLECKGGSLMELILSGDPVVKKALSDDPATGESLCATFSTIRESKGELASHTLAKQLYFPLEDAGEYHLLAPLFPTTLVDHAYKTMRAHRYGDEAKAARDARKNKLASVDDVHEYLDLAIQNFGGTKPQNISQLNSERHGENWLLASLPPTWISPNIRAPQHMESVFEGSFSKRRRVRKALFDLKSFLTKTAYNNQSIRLRRAEVVEIICDEVLQFGASLRELDPGWSASSDCKLHESERLWLDPRRCEEDEEFAKKYGWRDWPKDVTARFARWLNRALSSKKMLLGDSEYEEWNAVLKTELNSFHDYLEADRD